jgi:hypothetical protein
LIGEGAAVTAGLAGNEGIVVGGIVRTLFVCVSALGGTVVGVGSFSTILLVGMSSLPGGCRLVVALGISVATKASALSLADDF